MTEQEEYISYQIDMMTEGFKGLHLRTYESDTQRSWREYDNQSYVLRDAIINLLKSYAAESSYNAVYDLFQTILDFEIQFIPYDRKYTVESNINYEMFDTDYDDPVFPNLINSIEYKKKKEYLYKAAKIITDYAKSLKNEGK